jgi:hypothetical protein
MTDTLITVFILTALLAVLVLASAHVWTLGQMCHL